MAALWLAAIVVVVAACGRAGDEPADDRRARGALPGLTAKPGVPYELDPRPVPTFERVTMNGRMFRTADQAGQVMLINFWATWCAPCVREIPDLIALDEALGDSGLTIVGVSLDHDGFDSVRPFLDPFDPSYPIVLEEGLTGEFGDIFGLPATFLVDRSGRVVGRIDGLAKPDLLRQSIRRLLTSGTQP